ncbi:MAG: phosphatidylserine decarboxylase family protein [Deltaproteobacteria bacterium]|nr:phosphatidylserine decarboxylase family protein [Deltaproteobacteria bacterium]MBW2694597.1 phosphatidylserine decarboxylase family protein [Deltaproteobacteria bacterium]
MADSDPAETDSIFSERPTEFVVRDAFSLGVAPLALAGACGLLGWTTAGFVLLGLTVFVACFFRNPPREIPGGENSVVAPADGRVVDVAEVEGPDGNKWLRIGIFLSVFNVHVNRCPLAGRVVAKERGGQGFLAAFNPKAEAENVRCALTLETAAGMRFQVVQITGLIARRIVCHPQVGEWVRRGDRYGLIRFGSRTDVLLPLTAVAKVKVRDRVRGGSTIIAEFESTEG